MVTTDTSSLLVLAPADDITDDITCQVDDEELTAHRIILMARSPVFHALLNSEMREGVEGVVTIEDVRGPVFRALLHFVYTDTLPEVHMPCWKLLLVAACQGNCQTSLQY